MQTLMLMRHGTAVESYDAANDYARSLTPSGRLEVQNQVSRITQCLPEIIIVSSALRTAETASIVASFAKQNIVLHLEPALYLAQASDYFATLQTVADTVNTVLIIGHNPGISALASTLVKSPLSLAPADLVILQATPKAHWAELSIQDFTESKR